LLDFRINRHFMKVAKPKTVTAAAATARGLFFAGLLAVVLAALFWNNFLPGHVHFSNDGPLGRQNTAWSRLPGAFTEIWGDLNEIGNSGGSLAPGLFTLLRWLLEPVGYSKFPAPFAPFVLGLGVWTFFRQLKFPPLAAMLCDCRGGAGWGADWAMRNLHGKLE
jgi:hypothetical protein